MWGGSPEPPGAKRRAFLYLEGTTYLCFREGNCPLRGRRWGAALHNQHNYAASGEAPTFPAKAEIAFRPGRLTREKSR